MTISQWIVRDVDGHDHAFESHERAIAFAFNVAWADRGVTVASPEGAQWCIVRRSPHYAVVLQRVL